MLTIIGGGAVGLFLTSLLSKSNDVVLITKTNTQSKIINSRGIYISGLKKVCIKNVFSVSFNSFKLTNVLKESKILFICLKSYDTENVLKILRKKISKDTIIITLQNGLGNKDIIKKILPKNKVMESVATFGVIKVAYNKVIFSGKGDIIISDCFKKEKFLENDFGIRIRYVKNVEGYVLEKFVINCLINALGSILRVSNGELIKTDYAKNFMRQIFEEIVSVTKSYNINLPNKILRKTEQVCLKTASNINSMLQDILKHKYVTEIEFLNGKLLSMAKTKGLYLPANETLYELIKTIEQTNKKIYG